MLLEHERKYGLGMDALVTVCSWNTCGILVWAWMLWPPFALGTQAELWLGRGCPGHRMLLEHERNYGLGMDTLVTVCSWNTSGGTIWAWMLYSHCMLLEHVRNCGLGMDALVTVCSWNAELWLGHGCSGHRMLLEHVRNYGLGKDALVTVCSWNTSGIMVDALVTTCPRNSLAFLA